jgi:hypothetical protein
MSKFKPSLNQEYLNVVKSRRQELETNPPKLFGTQAQEASDAIFSLIDECSLAKVDPATESFELRWDALKKSRKGVSNEQIEAEIQKHFPGQELEFKRSFDNGGAVRVWTVQIKEK